jgi:hypothetical protein
MSGEGGDALGGLPRQQRGAALSPSPRSEMAQQSATTSASQPSRSATLAQGIALSSRPLVGGLPDAGALIAVADAATAGTRQPLSHAASSQPSCLPLTWPPRYEYSPRSPTAHACSSLSMRARAPHFTALVYPLTASSQPSHVLPRTPHSCRSSPHATSSLRP